jgi:hypothetical protein
MKQRFQFYNLHVDCTHTNNLFLFSSSGGGGGNVKEKGKKKVEGKNQVKREK